MELTMILIKETKNYLRYAQTNDGQNAIDNDDAVIGNLYLKKEDCKDLPELIRVTIEPA